MGKIGSHILKFLMILWAFMVIPDYFFNHPYYADSLKNFAYTEYLIFSIIGFGGFVFWRMGKKGDITKQFSLSISGWQVYLGIMISSLVLYILFHNKSGRIEGQAVVAGLRTIATGTMYSLAFFWLILSSFSIGQCFMKRIGEHYHPVSFKILSIALGISGIGFIATIIGLFQFMNPYLLWIITIIPVGIFHKEALDFLKSVFIRPVTYKALHLGKILPLLVMSIFLSTGFLSALKAFPIGFDGAGTYMNTASLIANYQALPEGGQPFNWAVIMSLGEIMFGEASISILISHFTILLAIVVVYRLARLAMTPSKSWIAISILLAIPAIVFQVAREEKTDFGLLFISLAAFLMVLEPQFSKQETTTETKPFWIWGMAGWLLGFAFGIKVLAIYSIVAMVALWAYRQWGKFGAFGVTALSISVLLLGGLNKMAYMDLTKREVRISTIIMAIVGIASLAYGWISHDKAFSKKHFGKLTAFSLLIIIPILPWGIKNISEHGQFSAAKIIKGKHPGPEIKANIKLYADQEDLTPLQDKRNKVIRMENDSLPERNYQEAPKKLKKNKTNLSTAEREEIKRYIGYEKGYALFHTIPYDATMGNNIPNRPYIDISFLFLLLLPLLLLRLDKIGNIANPIYVLVFITSLSGLAWISQYVPLGDYSNVENNIAAASSPWKEIGFNSFVNAWSGFIATILHLFKAVDWWLYQTISNFNFPSVLVIGILITAAAWWMVKEKFRQLDPAMQEMAVLLYTSFFLWFISSNNIPWYGFPILALSSIFIAYIFNKKEWLAGKENSTFTNYYLATILVIFFLSTTIFRFSNPEKAQEKHVHFIDHVFIQKAALGKNNEEILNDLSPVYNTAFSFLNNNMDDKIYRVGTQLNYHIKENDKRVFEDNQLRLFDIYNKRLYDTSRFASLLKENGFKYIIYDFNTPSLDMTTEQTLKKKSDAFLGLLFHTPGLNVVATDRIIQTGNPNDFVFEDGRKISGMKYGLGQLTAEFVSKYVKRNGTFMIFEIQ